MFEYIERFVCPTTTSDCILGGSPFVFARDAIASSELAEAALVLKESEMADPPTRAVGQLVPRGEDPARKVWALHEQH